MDDTTRTRLELDQGPHEFIYFPLQIKEKPGTLHSVVINGACWDVPKGKQNVYVPSEVARMIRERIDSETANKEDVVTDSGYVGKNLLNGELDPKMERALF